MSRISVWRIKQETCAAPQFVIKLFLKLRSCDLDVLSCSAVRCLQLTGFSYATPALESVLFITLLSQHLSQSAPGHLIWGPSELKPVGLRLG